MDDYLETAVRYYEGRQKRSTGEVGRRDERFTDTELGDRQLSHALWTVVMSAMWNVPLLEGQAERLDAAIQKRIEVIDKRRRANLQPK
jgi:hypothetical protein